MKHAVALIAYNRPAHTSKILKEIAAYGPPVLYAILDGPASSSDANLVSQVREVVKDYSRILNVQIISSEQNMGLKGRILTGLDEVFSKENVAIILEDDCIPSPNFFDFMDEGLVRFADSNSVLGLSGQSFFDASSRELRYFLSPLPLIWGWGTWSTKWKSFREANLAHPLSEEAWSHNPSFFARRRLKGMSKNPRNWSSWALLFAYYAHQNNLFFVTPSENLVRNVGFGLGATHTRFESYVDEPKTGMEKKHPAFLDPLPYPSTYRRMELYRLVKWVVWPMQHPVDFLSRALRFALGKMKQ